MQITSPCTPPDLLCHEEHWDQHKISVSEKLGSPCRKQAISTVYSYFPTFKMVIISAASLMQKDVWHVPLTSHTGLFHPGHSLNSSTVPTPGPPMKSLSPSLPLPSCVLLASSFQLREPAPQQLDYTSLLRIPPPASSKRIPFHFSHKCLPYNSSLPWKSRERQSFP